MYDPTDLRCWIAHDPDEDLRGVLDKDDYVEAMNALGITPTVDLDFRPASYDVGMAGDEESVMWIEGQPAAPEGQLAAAGSPR